MKKFLSVEDCDALTLEEIKDLYRRHVSPSLAEILDSFSFADELIVSAEGVWMTTKSGKRILDVTGGAGVLNLGHNPESILRARIRFQQEKRSEVHKSFFSPYLAALAHNLSCLTPGDLNYSYFCNSGAEAVEGAVKLAYKYHQGKRDLILHSDIAYHGKLLASGNLTAKSPREFRFQSVLKHDTFRYDDLESLREKIRQHGESIYAIIIEPYSATHLRGLAPEFLKELRRTCDERGIVLIFDEIYTGWFKTGPLFSFMHTDVVPDVLTVSKTLGGGKATISAYVSRDKIMKSAYGKVKEALLHSTTYNGYAEECITAIESLNLLQRPEIASRPAEIEKKFRQRVEKLSAKFPGVIEKSNGRGALHGLTFRGDRSLMERALRLLPTDFFMGDYFVEKLMIAGVIDRLFTKHQIHCLFMVAGAPSLLFAPSLVIRDEEIDRFFDALEDVLSEGTWPLVSDFIKKKLVKKFTGAK